MNQRDLFAEPLVRQPVAVAWGAGVDSTAMIVEMHRRGEPIDIVLHALTKWENPLMGWTSTGDSMENLARMTLPFDSKVSGARS